MCLRGSVLRLEEQSPAPDKLSSAELPIVNRCSAPVIELASRATSGQSALVAKWVEPNTQHARQSPMRRIAVAIFPAVLMMSCGDTDAPRPAAPNTENSQSGAPSADVERRIAELRAFRPDSALSGSQCDALSVSNGAVQLDAAGSVLARAIQASQPVPVADLRLVVHFGSGFPSFTCTDLESEVHEAIIDETWPASAKSATFTVAEGEACSSATLQLVDVDVQAPNGQLVGLDDITITNTAWQWWHPFECHLLDDPPKG